MLNKTEALIDPIGIDLFELASITFVEKAFYTTQLFCMGIDLRRSHRWQFLALFLRSTSSSFHLFIICYQGFQSTKGISFRKLTDSRDVWVTFFIYNVL